MTPTTPGAPGRPRRAETDASIHEAALRLLRTGGSRGVTVEAVAAASGVAKTTIYRRYSDREDVLRAALSAVIVPPENPVGETPRDRIRWALDQTWHQMSDVLGPGGLATILREDDPQFSELFRGVLTPYTDALVELIRSDIAAGALRPGLEPDTVVSLLIGAYVGELVRRGAVADGFIDRCVDLMWAAMTEDEARSRARR
ncbi:TetR/AcrR family transcriptional regulator [Nocardioides glacieisoli]|uniref:TetR/AcrR family transcriptional regulator n=1 Tax=Nocardioides glacieisoli TaxID=1168730 RepID=A0A4Q2RQ69_9ACTN|nr:TetR/AcrR family transcriptional regulator [Nocardioides glacieisoli]RYB90626.1 TetR/AcrR family transcriptional regulator [Nocardioides glacieisoli]